MFGELKMIGSKLRYKIQDKIYRLLESTHKERRKQLFGFGKGELAVAMYMSSHGNKVQKKDLTEYLEDIGYKHDGAVTTIHRMEEKQKLIETEFGFLSVKPPLDIAIKKQAGLIVAMKVLGIPFSIILFVVAIDLNNIFLAGLSSLWLIYALIVVIDEFLHTTPY